MRWLLLALLPLSAAAAEHWVRFTSGPFEVYSSARPKDARETLVRLEEFRHALGYVLSDQDLETPIPIRILLFPRGAPQLPEPIVRGRDRYAGVLNAPQSPSPELLASLTQLFLETNTNRLPERIERGIVELFSTIDVTGIRITLGRPPTHPDLDWARVHLLSVDPVYFSNLRVLTYNLRKGIDEDAAFHNAFSKSPEQIEIEAQQHLAAGNFRTTSISPLPMSAHDFEERSVEPVAAQLAVADLLLDGPSRTAYHELIVQKTEVPEAHEGLGMLALRDHANDEARQEFAAAVAAGSKSANCYLEYARLEPDKAKAIDALEHAVKLNPKLAEPHFLISEREAELPKRIQQLQQATKLDARNLEYWQALAQAYTDAHDFKKAEQAWRSAEQAARTPVDRSRMERARAQVEQQRLDWEDAERRREADENAREVERLKAQARAEVHSLEARANQGQTAPLDQKVVPWWDGPQPDGYASGVLKQVDCLGKRLRLVLQSDDQKIVKLLVNNPSKIAVLSGGKLALACGTQPRLRVKIGYFPKPNSQLATAGEVATIEFE